MRRTLHNEHGSALLVVLMMLLALSAMAASAVMISGTDLVVAGNQRQSMSALNVAEAGVSEALHRLAQPVGTMANVAGNNIDIAIRDPNNPPSPDWRARIYMANPGSEPAPGANETSHPSLQGGAGQLDYASANDPAEAITVQHKTRDFDGDGVAEVVFYDPSLVPPENPDTGTPVERVIVTGRQGRSERTVMVDAIRFPLNPNVQAGLQSNEAVDLRGNVTVCGQNHQLLTPDGTQLPACSPAWDMPSGPLNAVMTSGDAIMTQGSTDLLGQPTATNDDPANPFYSLADALGITQEDLDLIMSDPDVTDVGAAMPWEGLVQLPGGTKISGGSGEGLLHVTGDLDISGNFNWRGLIYVEGDFKCTGNAWILGAVIVRGASAVGVDFGAGTIAVLYSRDALVRALNLAMDYVVLAWKEL